MMLRRIAWVSLLAMLFLLLAALPSDGRGGRGGHRGRHHGHGSHSVVVAGALVVGPAVPVLVLLPSALLRAAESLEEEPPVYIEPPRPAQPGGYWYYCPSAKAYYPEVSGCPEPWIRVPATRN